jgi:hypothetical protein
MSAERNASGPLAQLLSVDVKFVDYCKKRSDMCLKRVFNCLRYWHRNISPYLKMTQVPYNWYIENDEILKAIDLTRYYG